MSPCSRIAAMVGVIRMPVAGMAAALDRAYCAPGAAMRGVSWLPDDHAIATLGLLWVLVASSFVAFLGLLFQRSLQALVGFPIFAAEAAGALLAAGMGSCLLTEAVTRSCSRAMRKSQELSTSWDCRVSCCWHSEASRRSQNKRGWASLYEDAKIQGHGILPVVKRMRLA
eukprot:TRINITY_DN36499_c0_g1_i1.p1 TRINITY_DN36499_c0_g1~~TRINITY_DN36499_c0_g1_i1.p1  ORF type:complete len:170 (-),score=27.70 TRINITY_DN36499_c0_g1_i1:10-519(-)